MLDFDFEKKSQDPMKTAAEQGLLGIMEVFLDTIVICTLTAFAILTSGVAIPYGHTAGSELTAAAFTSASS